MYAKNKNSIIKEFIVFKGKVKEAIKNLNAVHDEEILKDILKYDLLTQKLNFTNTLCYTWENQQQDWQNTQ